ncbi:Thymidylate kinase [compost metagenome]
MPNPVKPFFLVLEGVDFSGKTTLRERIVEWLRTVIPNEVVVTREPGGTPFAEEIREVLLKPRDEVVEPMAELLGFMCGRRQHLEMMIRPKLELGSVVVSDRFVDSSFTMQCWATDGGVSMDKFFQLEELVLDGFRPDAVIYLDIDPAVSMQRQLNAGRSKDRIEAKGLDYHQAIRDGFLDRYENQSVGGKIHIIDASMSADEVFHHAQQFLIEHFV